MCPTSLPLGKNSIKQLGLPSGLIPSALSVRRFQEAHAKEVGAASPELSMPEFVASTVSFIYVMVRWASNLKGDSQVQAKLLLESFIRTAVPASELAWDEGPHKALAGELHHDSGASREGPITVEGHKITLENLLSPGAALRAAVSRSACMQ
eukprot:6158404-Lingulodinium_polyedra.AAC.1